MFEGLNGDGMLIKNKILRYRRGLKTRLYKFHPRSFIYDYHCRRNPDTPLTVTIESGVKARIWPGDAIGKPLYIGGMFEEYEVKFLRRVLRPGMVFFDIGANMGYYSLMAAKAVGPEGRVHCFEPSPRMFGELKHNVELNGFKNVRINPAALGEKPGKACLPRHERGKEVYGCISDLAGAAGDYDEVAVDTLDGYAERNGIDRIDVIKIDVEGAELPVFKGARGFLSRPDAPLILFEMVESFASKFDYTCREAVDFLGSLGYGIYSITDGVDRLTGDFAFNTHVNNFAAVKEAHIRVLP